MENQSMLSLCERPFSPEVTMKQIVGMSNDNFNKWNLHPIIQCMCNEHNEVVGMMMKLDHENFKDFVFITLSWDDTYRIRFFDTNGNEVEDITFIFCDQLFEVIDRKINEFVRFEMCLN